MEDSVVNLPFSHIQRGYKEKKKVGDAWFFLGKHSFDDLLSVSHILFSPFNVPIVFFFYTVFFFDFSISQDFIAEEHMLKRILLWKYTVFQVHCFSKFCLLSIKKLSKKSLTPLRKNKVLWKILCSLVFL